MSKRNMNWQKTKKKTKSLFKCIYRLFSNTQIQKWTNICMSCRLHNIIHVHITMIEMYSTEKSNDSIEYMMHDKISLFNALLFCVNYSRFWMKMISCTIRTNMASLQLYIWITWVCECVWVCMYTFDITYYESSDEQYNYNVHQMPFHKTHICRVSLQYDCVHDLANYAFAGMLLCNSDICTWMVSLLYAPLHAARDSIFEQIA